MSQKIIDNFEIQRWLKDGKTHRVDGPAVIYPSGYHEWWLNGRYMLSEDEWLEKRKPFLIQKNLKSIL